MLSTAMTDRLHQSYRSTLIPGFDDVVDAATSTGALSVVLSGAGPTIAAYCLNNMEQVGKSMQEAFSENDIRCEIKILGTDIEGAKVWT